MKIKRFICCLLLVFSLFVLASCNKSPKVLQDITIVYTNDVHSYIGNTDTVKNNVVTKKALRINKVTAYVNSLKESGKNVLFVDAGDHVQGTAYGSYDDGASVISIMNEAGYDLATIGNHEFDYGMDKFNQNVEAADFDYISCNFKKNNQRVLNDTKIFTFGDTKIGFVGVSTPSTIQSSTPKYFQNENGEYIYSFDGQANCNDLYNTFQQSVDSIKNQCDYVVGLGHLGIDLDAESQGVSSDKLIENTNGIKAFIDGHSHSVIEADDVKNKDNKDVRLTQTGYYLNYFGVMELKADGTITTKLETYYDGETESVKNLENALITNVNNTFGQKIATSDIKFYVSNSENPNQRYIRARETNNGDLTADSVYWYFNESMNLNCDVAIVNGGGIRTDIAEGDITYLNCKNNQPFGNVVCLIKATGQQLLDALEMGVDVCGKWDTLYDNPAENGGFLHVAGMKYQVDCSIESALIKNGDDFAQSPTTYKVKNVMIYNKQTCQYEALDLQKEYTIGGSNYLLRNGGNGLTMLKNCSLVVDYVGQDYMLFAQYLKSFKEVDGFAKINTANSKLSEYENYLINYENPNGAGRIEILNPQY